MRQAHSRTWRDGNAAQVLTAVCSVTPQAEANGATTVLKAMYRKLITPVIDKTLKGRVRQRKHDGAVKCSRILKPGMAGLSVLAIGLQRHPAAGRSPDAAKTRLHHADE